MAGEPKSAGRPEAEAEARRAAVARLGRQAVKRSCARETKGQAWEKNRTTRISPLLERTREDDDVHQEEADAVNRMAWPERYGSCASGDGRLRHRFQAVGQAGSRDAIQLPIAPDRKAQRFREFRFVRLPAEVPFEPESRLLALSNEPPDGTRQRIELPEVVENGSPDSVLGQGLEQAVTLGIEAINGADESEDAGLVEIVEFDLTMATEMRAPGKQLDLRQVIEDELFAGGDGSDGGHRRLLSGESRWATPARRSGTPAARSGQGRVVGGDSEPLTASTAGVGRRDAGGARL